MLAVFIVAFQVEASSVWRLASSKEPPVLNDSSRRSQTLDARRQTPPTRQTPDADSLPIISLEEALRRSQALDPQYVAAQGDVGNAEWARRAALSAMLLPSVSVGSDASKFSAPTFNLGTGNLQDVAVSARADARYELFTGGRKWADLSSSRANLRRAEARELEARYATSLRTEGDFYQVLLDQELDRVARERVQRAEEQLVVARARVTSGASVQTDSLQLRLELNRAQVGLLRQNADLRISRLQLGRRVGYDGPVQAAPLDVRELPRLPLTLADAVAEARENGPQYVAARASEEAAEALVRAQSGSYLPTLSMSASTAAFDNTFFPGATRRSSVTLAASLPIWNNGQRELALSQAQAVRATARAVRRDAERAVERDVTERYEAYETARATVGLTADAVGVARENYRVQQTRYLAGAGTILELLEAQDGLTQAEADLVRARYDAGLALAGLEAILGRRLLPERISR
jgi:outer membrane protein